MTAAVPLCAEISRSRQEPLAGTAAHAKVVLAVEERCAWAPKAIRSGGLDAIRSVLESWVETLGARLQLIRHPSRCAGPRRVYICSPGPSGTLHQFDLEDSEFETFDLQSALRSEASSRPIHLVCVHGKRDRCCALEGGSYFRARETSPDVWMTSHLGGHRFAATTLTLPSGFCHGHLNTDQAALPFTELPTDKLRGRVCYPGAVQAAEASLLASHPSGIFSLKDVQEMNATEIRVTFQSEGAAFERTLRKVMHAPQVLGCGDVAKPSASWLVEIQP
ncbi:MAG: sucrase ferredoxin [Polyangiales bacterium]